MGEALIDLIISADGSIAAVPGGGPFNLARAAARLGADVTFAGGVSDDAFGRQIQGLLDADGVATPLTTRTGRPTTLALAQLDATGAATYIFYMDGTSGAMVYADEMRPAPGTRAIAAGTLGLVMDPVATGVEQVILEASAETLVFVDPNCRPSTVRDRASYTARIDRVLSRADVVKVSTDDVEFLRPDAAVRDAARALLDLGPKVVLLTDGGKSVSVLHAGGSFDVATPSITVVDTVGAGDSFGGAFLAFWLAADRGVADLADLDALRATVEKCVQVAAITCTRQGANPPRLDELPAALR